MTKAGRGAGSLLKGTVAQDESLSCPLPFLTTCLPPPSIAHLVPTRFPVSVPSPLLSVQGPPNLGPLLYLLCPSLWQYPWFSLHLCAPVGGCVSICLTTSVPVSSPCSASLPSLLSRFRLPPAALARTPPPARLGRLGSGCSNSGETASGSAPSAEPHSSRAGPLLFAASPAPPRPPGGREGGRDGVIEKASERAGKEPGAPALPVPSSPAALPRLTELRPLPEPGASPPPRLALPPSLTRGAQPLPLPAYTHTLSPDAWVQAWPHSRGRWPAFHSPALGSPRLQGGGCSDPDWGARTLVPSGHFSWLQFPH